MAIIIHEEKRGGQGWFGFGVAFITLTILGVASYYLFFIKPDLIDSKVAPVKIESIEELRKLNFKPETVLTGDALKDRQTIPVPTPNASAGNQAPFGVM
jgi:hypothetical protein